jgi:hypothetical protein
MHSLIGPPCNESALFETLHASRAWIFPTSAVSYFRERG